MANLQDIINLSKVDGGKFFVIDERGEAKLVIMSVEEYQRLLLGKLQRQVEDVEKINQEIIKAQIMEPQVALEILKPKPPRSSAPPRVDLREEVIDPSFNFEGPKVEIDDL
ncbi:MAG: hypothetical protein HYZ51_03605 [Candidatus Doudnabacteria bacterium]|nr:hypothetical protein [Candidatus Doudnabacteria bacterium]